MGLNICAAVNGVEDYSPERCVAFEYSSGFWEFLQPWIRAYNLDQGERIDLYEHYFLSSQKLLPLLEKLLEAKSHAVGLDGDPVVILGYRSEVGVKKVVEQVVPRGDLIVFVDKLIAVVRKAIAEREPLGILGD